MKKKSGGTLPVHEEWKQINYKCPQNGGDAFKLNQKQVNTVQLKCLKTVHLKLQSNEFTICETNSKNVDVIRQLELVVLVDKFPYRYKTVFIVVLVFEDVIYHHFMMCVILRVSMSLKFFLQVVFHL